MTLALAIVLAAVFAAAWLMRRLRGFGHRNVQAIQVVADVSLGGKERAVLVQVGATQILIGVAPGQVNALHVFGENSAIGNLEPAPIENQNTASPDAHQLSASFKAILKRSLGMQ